MSEVLSFLKYSDRARCKDDSFHHIGPFLVDEVSGQVHCGTCKQGLNPVWVLKQMAMHENRWMNFREVYMAQKAELEAKRKTKCQHCKRMTRISVRGSL